MLANTIGQLSTEGKKYLSQKAGLIVWENTHIATGINKNK
jgi:hypothetical protein